jgi:pyruvate kinase
MVELRGREIRISKILDASNQMKIRAGSIVNLIAGQYDQPSDANNFRINTSEMQKVLKPNDVIYFDDGKVIGIIIDIQPSSARMEIKIGGVMKGCS